MALPPVARTVTPIADTASHEASAPITFAVIGDYGTGDAHERAVAKLVASWDPAFVITTGDGYYSEAGGKGMAKYGRSTGAYYGKWLENKSAKGKRLPVGKGRVNSFFPSLGNHDYHDATPGPKTYLKYFRLPGKGHENSSRNERYYDFVKGPVHFFVLNSNKQERHGVSWKSRQARWLKEQLAKSSSEWNIVYQHHSPYSSDGRYGCSPHMRWPFAAWGADVVISGHSHTYERIMRDGVVYFVNGLGGGARYRNRFSTPVRGSAVRYRANWGAQKVTVTDTKLKFAFYDVKGRLVDSYTLEAGR